MGSSTKARPRPQGGPGPISVGDSPGWCSFRCPIPGTSQWMASIFYMAPIFHCFFLVFDGTIPAYVLSWLQYGFGIVEFKVSQLTCSFLPPIANWMNLNLHALCCYLTHCFQQYEVLYFLWPLPMVVYRLTFKIVQQCLPPFCRFPIRGTMIPIAAMVI
eukprot:Lithocolla_globosa_v1_NODE_8_length_11455_cov_155.660175.p6 type:complete len:159 gc:universal NODE_8_length_11455_cov_155.660175:1681-2157(+)